MERIIFQNRPVIIATFALLTGLMVILSTQLRVDTSLEAQLPQWRYVQNTAMPAVTNDADRIMIALSIDKNKRNSIFRADFFQALQQTTTALAGIPGIAPGSIVSILTSTDYPEDILPRHRALSDDDLEKLHSHFLETGHPGRLIAQDFSTTLISAELSSAAIQSEIAHSLTTLVRQFEQTHSAHNFQMHVIGKPLLARAIVSETRNTLWWLGGIMLLMGLLMRIYSDNLTMTLIPWGCALAAAIWQIGLIWLLGFKLHPLLTIAPFIAFLFVLVHGLQLVNSIKIEVFGGALDIIKISQTGLHRLLLSGSMILLSHMAALVLLLLVGIEILQQLAIIMLVGLVPLALINLVLLPVCLSYVPMGEGYRKQTLNRARRQMRLWEGLARFAEPRPAGVVIVLALAIAAYTGWSAPRLSAGTYEATTALQQNARYRSDMQLITQRFEVEFNVLSVLLSANTCDRIHQVVENLSTELKRIRGASTMSLGMENSPVGECADRSLRIFLQDRQPATVIAVFEALERVEKRHTAIQLKLTPNGGNAVTSAVINEVLQAWYPLLGGILAALLLCIILIGFRGFIMMLCVVLPTCFAACLAHLLFSWSDIGLTVMMLPMLLIGLAINIGYSVYLFCRLKVYAGRERGFQSNYLEVLESVGGATIFGGLAWFSSMLIVGLAAPLQWLATMGITLAIMTSCGLLATLMLTPALATTLSALFRKHIS